MCSNSKQIGRWIAIAAVIGLVCFSQTLADKPPKPEPEEPTSGYRIVSLASPEGDPSHSGIPISISDPSPAGDVHVVGYRYSQASNANLACCWTVDADGNVEVEDVSSWLWNFDLDVNSAGVICGRTNTDGTRSLALLFPDGEFVVLPAEALSVRLNNPSEEGVLQVVGGNVMWDVATDGNLLLATPLVDDAGAELYAHDVNDYQEIAGFVYVDNELGRVPAIGRFVEGQLEITPLANPNPSVITGFLDIQIDNGGNVLGYGAEPASLGAHYPRAVIWPTSGDAIDLVAEQRLNQAQGKGIATVDGVMQVVGNAYANSGRVCYVYASGELYDLNRISEGDEPWDIWAVEDVNHAGMICGYGKVGKRRDYREEACLLIPTNR